ncbi:MAG: RluA family pseudouridine synthase [Bacteroidales bacterium]|jgi:23S rRNA pseudouridine1911/1915/1917 synthase|nr:RluA family pseudouridine synthase [Bacteroidales bacterium]
MQVIYEDNHLLAVNKACGEIVQGDKTGDQTVIERVKAWLKTKYSKAGEVYLGSPHRLDRPTSGVLLFAKTGKALTRLNALFQDKTAIKKTYWAMVDQLPEKETDTLVHYIWKDESKNKSFATDSPRHGGVQCSLTYWHKASLDRYHLLVVELHTGRHHQIRAQLAKIGLHIKGDLKYGAARSNPDGSIHLHARQLEFIHPVKNEPVRITANPPKDPLWNAIMQIKDIADTPQELRTD